MEPINREQFQINDYSHRLAIAKVYVKELAEEFAPKYPNATKSTDVTAEEKDALMIAFADLSHLVQPKEGDAKTPASVFHHLRQGLRKQFWDLFMNELLRLSKHEC